MRRTSPMEDKKRAIKVSTLDELAAGFQESRSITDKLTTKQMIAFAKEPVGGGENKLIPFLQGDTTLEITKTDLQDLQEPLRDYAFAYAKAKSIELPEQITTLSYGCFYGATIETIKTYANTFNQSALGVASTDNITVNLYLLANDFTTSTNPWFYNNTSKKFNIHFNNEEAYSNYLYAASQNTGSTFTNIADNSIYFGENLATEVNISSKLTTFGKTPLFIHEKGLTKIKFLGDITYIPDYSFYKCTSLIELDFTANTTVPILANDNAFGSIAKNYRIKVPTALYNEWISATNWSSIASHIVAV